MAAFDETYWNLSQAAAWVEYRSKDLVERYHRSAASYTTIRMYPKMGPPLPDKIGELADLHHALCTGRLKAFGDSHDSQPSRAEIPADHWEDLDLRPPVAYHSRRRAQQHEPWTDIRVRSADLQRLWRSTSEVQGRTRFDWDEVRKIYDEARKTHPGFTQNELIIEVQGLYRDRFKKEPPARSSMQNHIKDWQ